MHSQAGEKRPPATQVQRKTQKPNGRGGRFFDPGSIFWQVNREASLMLFGIRALLMQLAHPKVAQGVADHSHFQEDPLGRSKRTFQIVDAIIFGTREEAIAAAAAMHARHQQVQGRLAEHVPGMNDAYYDATDPTLLLWVNATLVDSALLAYETFHRRLSDEEREAYYQESKLAAKLFGIDEHSLPETVRDFERWMEHMLASNAITVTETARQQAYALFHGSLFTSILWPVNYVIATVTLPPKLRQAYGLRCPLPVRIAYRLGVHIVRLLVRILPANVRAIPEARQAERMDGYR